MQGFRIESHCTFKNAWMSGRRFAEIGRIVESDVEAACIGYDYRVEYYRFLQEDTGFVVF